MIARMRERLQKHYEQIGHRHLPTIEAESLLGDARVTGGSLRVQNMAGFNGQWGDDAQLWWVEAEPGDRLSLPIEVAETGTYDLVGFFTRARDYGIIRLHVNDAPVGDLVDGYNDSIEATGPVSFGRVSLHAGVNEVVVELVGKDSRASGFSNGYLVGIDGFQLRR